MSVDAKKKVSAKTWEKIHELLACIISEAQGALAASQDDIGLHCDLISSSAAKLERIVTHTITLPAVLHLAWEGEPSECPMCTGMANPALEDAIYEWECKTCGHLWDGIVRHREPDDWDKER